MTEPPPRQDPMAVLWERLHAADPHEVAARADVRWHPDAGAYAVPLLDLPIQLVPADRRVQGPEGFPGWEPMLCCVQYLLTARDEPRAGEWVSPASLPYGAVFFRGLHEPPTGGIERAFAEQAEAFRASAAQVGGRPLEMGDAAAELPALPRVPVAVVLWLGDDEFPARAQFLFDKGADRQLPLDALWVLTKVVARRLVAAAD